MNIIDNALSAKNIKIHGMSSSKWTIRDKVTQFKGLVNLYHRDREITQLDTDVGRRKAKAHITTLKKNIDTRRKELENSLRGNRQRLHNSLAENRELQLAHQQRLPKKVIDDIVQLNFTQRKTLDRLQYQLKQKSQALEELKLEESVLEDRIKYFVFSQLPDEKTAQIITGKVQDAVLKKEAALAIKHTYLEIISIMKKDALYFDAILCSIERDYWYQCRCILNATKQGQLATEYKDDREQEYARLEKKVRQDMQAQRRDLALATAQSTALQASMKQLLRRDSDLTTCAIKLEDSGDYLQLKKDLADIEATLEFLKEATLVTSFERIYPSLREQMQQQSRLNVLVKKCSRNRDVLLNKLNHAECMKNLLDNTMVDTYQQFKLEKKELLAQIQDEEQQLKRLQEEKMFKIDLTARISTALKHLQQLCSTIRTVEEKSEDKARLRALETDLVVAPREFETDPVAILQGIKARLPFLLSSVQVRKDLELSDPDAAFNYYELMMVERGFQDGVKIAAKKDFMEDFDTEVSSILTRDDIKRQSAEILAANAGREDAVKNK